MVGNFVTVVIVVGAMFFLSWQITLAALILLPIFLVPARFVGQRIGSLTKEGYDLNSEMNMVMQERFQVGGAMLVKLMGRPEAEAASFEAKAGRVRDIGIAQATYARVFFVALYADRLPRHGHRLRRRRRRRRQRRPPGRHRRRPDQLPHPALPAADPALEPEPRRDDCPRLLRAALRGPRHRAHDRRRTPTPSPSHGGTPPSSSTR